MEAGYNPQAAFVLNAPRAEADRRLVHGAGRFRCINLHTGELRRPPGNRVVDASVRSRMQDVLAEIQSGKFADEWNHENQKGERYEALLEEDLNHPIEEVGARLRSRMACPARGGGMNGAQALCRPQRQV